MKRLFAITVVVLLSSAIFFLVPCAAGDPVTKPVKITWTGILYSFTSSESCPAGTFQSINIAKGLSTLYGESDWLGVYCLRFASATSITGSGWGILTAANGDQVHALIDVTVDLSKNPVEWSETEFIVGGTGKFEGATGTSEGEVTF